MQREKSCVLLSGCLCKKFVKQRCKAVCKSGLLLRDRLCCAHLNMINLIGVDKSHLTGALLCGKSPEEATRIAVDFTHEAMVHTLDNGLPLRYGVAFEQAIPGLVRALGL